MNGKYGTADTVLSLINIVGWIGIAGGIYIVFRGLGSYSPLGLVLIGGSVIGASAVLITLAQLAWAQIDTAISTAAMLVLMQEQAKADRKADGKTQL